MFKVCTVIANIKNPSGQPVSGIEIIIELSKRVKYQGTVIPVTRSAFTDKDGIAKFDLWPNYLLTDVYTYYIVAIKWSQNKIETFNIRVMDLETANLEDLEIRDVSKYVPAQEVEDKMSEFLNKIEMVESKASQSALSSANSAASAKSTEQSIGARISIAENSMSETLAKGQNVLTAVSTYKDEINTAYSDIKKIEDDSRRFRAQYDYGIGKINTSVLAAQTSESQSKSYVTEAKEALINIQVAVSDAATINQDIKDESKEIKTIKTEMESIRQQILDALPHGGQQSTVLTVVRTTFAYVTTEGQTLISGIDIEGKTLSYTVGFMLLFKNGLVLKNGEDYLATTGNSVTLTDPCAKGDWIAILDLSSISNGGGALDPATLQLIQESVRQAQESAAAAKLSENASRANATLSSNNVTFSRANASTSEFNKNVTEGNVAKTMQDVATTNDNVIKTNEDVVKTANNVLLTNADVKSCALSQINAGNSESIAKGYIDDIKSIIGPGISQPILKQGDGSKPLIVVDLPGYEMQSIVTGSSNVGGLYIVDVLQEGWVKITAIAPGGAGTVSKTINGVEYLNPKLKPIRIYGDAIGLDGGGAGRIWSINAGSFGASVDRVPVENGGVASGAKDAAARNGGTGILGDDNQARSVTFKGETYLGVAGGRGGASGAIMDNEYGFMAPTISTLNIGFGAGMVHPMTATVVLTKPQREANLDITNDSGGLYWNQGYSTAAIPMTYPFINGVEDVNDPDTKGQEFFGAYDSDGIYHMPKFTSTFGYGGGSYAGISQNVISSLQGGGGGAVEIRYFYVKPGKIYINLDAVKSVYKKAIANFQRMWNGAYYLPTIHGGYPPAPGIVIIEPLFKPKKVVRAKREALFNNKPLYTEIAKLYKEMMELFDALNHIVDSHKGDEPLSKKDRDDYFSHDKRIIEIQKRMAHLTSQLEE